MAYLLHSFIPLAFVSAACSAGLSPDAASPVLRVDLRQDDATFLRGEPITFAVRLIRSGLDSGPDWIIGSDDRPWYEQCRVSVYMSNKKSAAFVYVVDGQNRPGDTAETRTLLSGPTSPDVQTPQVTLTRQKRGATAYYTILTDDFAPEKWVIEASLPATTMRGDQAPQTVEFESKTVAFRVRNPIDASDRVRLARAVAGYRSLLGDYQSAADVLVAVLDAAAANRLVHIDLGLAWERLGLKSSAIEQYVMYIEWARNSGIPRSDRRGPQEIADEFEERVARLRSAL